MTKKFGFTLAEVLITLGIIGVVAAMTIPTLIANTNSAKFRAQFKKALSTLNQAGLMAQAQYDFDYSSANTACGADPAVENPTSTMTFCSLLNGTLTGHTYLGKVSDIKVNTTGNESTASGTYFDASKMRILSGGANYLAYALADGSYVAFSNGAKNTVNCQLDLGSKIDETWLNNHPQCLGFIDVNGKTLPNKEVSCTKQANTSTDVTTPCEVKNDAAHMTDIYPIVFHDATVEPASNAAKYVLTTSK